MQQGVLALDAVAFVPLLEQHAGQIEVGEHVAEPGGKHLALLELRAEAGHGGVGGEAEAGGQACDVAGVGRGDIVEGNAGLADAQPLGQGAGGVAEDQPAWLKKAWSKALGSSASLAASSSRT